jgi:hypothetical protein
MPATRVTLGGPVLFVVRLHQVSHKDTLCDRARLDRLERLLQSQLVSPRQTESAPSTPPTSNVGKPLEGSVEGAAAATDASPVPVPHTPGEGEAGTAVRPGGPPDAPSSAPSDQHDQHPSHQRTSPEASPLGLTQLQEDGQFEAFLAGRMREDDPERAAIFRVARVRFYGSHYARLRERLEPHPAKRSAESVTRSWTLRRTVSHAAAQRGEELAEEFAAKHPDRVARYRPE